jgi:hypothetical protein
VYWCGSGCLRNEFKGFLLGCLCAWTWPGNRGLCIEKYLPPFMPSIATIHTHTHTHTHTYFKAIQYRKELCTNLLQSVSIFTLLRCITQWQGLDRIRWFIDYCPVSCRVREQNGSFYILSLTGEILISQYLWTRNVQQTCLRMSYKDTANLDGCEDVQSKEIFIYTSEKAKLMLCPIG